MIIFLAYLFASCVSKDKKFVSDIHDAVYFKDKGDYTTALNFVKSAINYDSSKSFLFVLKGQIESSLENDTVAIKSFTKAIDIDPGNISSYFYKALSFSLLDYEDSAVANFNKAINLKQIPGKAYFEEINQTHIPLEEQTDVPLYQIKYFRALSFFNLEKYFNALDDFEYSLHNKYSISNSQYYIGLCNAKLGNKSVACFYLMLSKNSGNIDAVRIINEYCK